MNHDLQTGLAWIGGLTVLAYIGFGIWISAASLTGSRRIEAKRAALRARRTPITEAEIAAVDIDAELEGLLKEDTK